MQNLANPLEKQRRSGRHGAGLEAYLVEGKNMLTRYYDAWLERFVRYVKIDTQSDPESTTYPSTAKQFDLLKLLRDECEAFGLRDVDLDEH